MAAAPRLQKLRDEVHVSELGADHGAFMKMTRSVLGVMLLLAGFSANAETDRIPLIEGQQELFEATNLTADQCTVEVKDMETGAEPDIDFEATTKRTGGNFLGNKFLTSWSHLNPETFVSVQAFTSSFGRKLFVFGPELTYKDRSSKSYTIKNSQFTVLVDANRSGAEFKERLSYEVRDDVSSRETLVADKSRYDSDLRTVGQPVDVSSTHVKFTRTTDTGIKITAECAFDSLRPNGQPK